MIVSTQIATFSKDFHFFRGLIVILPRLKFISFIFFPLYLNHVAHKRVQQTYYFRNTVKQACIRAHTYAYAQQHTRMTIFPTKQFSECFTKQFPQRDTRKSVWWENTVLDVHATYVCACVSSSPSNINPHTHTHINGWAKKIKFIYFAQINFIETLQYREHFFGNDDN